MKLILKGLGVSRGKAQGLVKIIKGAKDAAKFNQGDVLVAKITDPSMVMMMGKAAAIVTDIGSMTSHPSIVSREMGIPCVVNTKNASSQLEDGLLVEVDGGTGEVFILDDQDGSPVEIRTESRYDVDKFLDAFVEACCQMDFRTFDEGIFWVRFDPLIAISWTQRIFKMIDDCEKEQLTPVEVARLFANTSDLRNKMLFDLWMAKYARVSTGERMKMFEFYADLLHAFCLEDPYAVSKNVIHSKEEIKDILSQVKPASLEIAKKLGRLVNACYHFSHAAYSDMNPSNVYDNYLPYYTDKGHLVVIKEFSNLKPQQLWREAETMPLDKVEIVCVYEGLKATIDSISHVVYDGDVVTGLKSFRLLVDGQEFPLEQVDNLVGQIEEASVKIYERFKNFSLEDKKKLYYHQKAHGYKRIYERLRQDWRPTPDILEEAANKDLYEVNWPEDKAAQKKLFRQILDPRKAS